MRLFEQEQEMSEVWLNLIMWESTEGKKYKRKQVWELKILFVKST